jgi:hypothetical protein
VSDLVALELQRVGVVAGRGRERDLDARSSATARTTGSSLIAFSI